MDTQGSTVTGVTKYSAANLAGIQVGDILLMIDGNVVSNVGSIVGGSYPGQNVEVKYQRGNAQTSVRVTLGAKYDFRLPAGAQRSIPLTLSAGEQLSMTAFDATLNNFIMKVTDPAGKIILHSDRVDGFYSTTIVAIVAGTYTVTFDLYYSSFSGRDMSLCYMVESR